MSRILVVDDEEDVLEFLSDEFASRGYEVDTANNGARAIEKLIEYKPHLMLLDMRMPGMSGIETLKQAKEINPNVSVIMVTAVHDEDVAKEAMNCGAKDYITKPIDLTYLNLTVIAKIEDSIEEIA